VSKYKYRLARPSAKGAPSSDVNAGSCRGTKRACVVRGVTMVIVAGSCLLIMIDVLCEDVVLAGLFGTVFLFSLAICVMCVM